MIDFSFNAPDSELQHFELTIPDGFTASIEDNRVIFSKSSVLNPSYPIPKAIDLGLPSGTLWADCNLGASSPEESGHYFRWGEITPHEDYEKFLYPHLCNGKFKDIGSDIAGTQYDAAFVHLGKSWCMPNEVQFKELLEMCSFNWKSYKGVWGMKITGPNNNFLFIPASGYRFSGSGSLDNVGDNGYCWSSSAGVGVIGRQFSFYSSDWDLHDYGRANGFPIRPVIIKKR